MSEFLQTCLDKYVEISPVPVKFHKVKTPFIDEDDAFNQFRRPIATGVGLKCPWCDGCFPKNTFVEMKSADPIQKRGRTSSSTKSRNQRFIQRWES